MARALGRGGQKAVVAASKMSSHTVLTGTKEVDTGAELSERVRREGGGRPRLIDTDLNLLQNLDGLVSPLRDSGVDQPNEGRRAAWASSASIMLGTVLPEVAGAYPWHVTVGGA